MLESNCLIWRILIPYSVEKSWRECWLFSFETRTAPNHEDQELFSLRIRHNGNKLIPSYNIQIKQTSSGDVPEPCRFGFESKIKYQMLDASILQLY